MLNKKTKMKQSRQKLYLGGLPRLFFVLLFLLLHLPRIILLSLINPGHKPLPNLLNGHLHHMIIKPNRILTFPLLNLMNNSLRPNPMIQVLLGSDFY